MRYLVTGKDMKLLDQNTSEHFHVPTVVLMEQAAMTFVQKLFEISKPNKVLVAVGSGNNGADGIAIARLLNQKGVDAGVYFCDSKKGTELFELQKKIYNQYTYNIIESLDDSADFDVIIDGLFGIGLSRNITGIYQETIEKLNSLGGIKVAIDIASGVSADNGDVLGCAFRADYTITFSFEKLGQHLWPGSDFSGQLLLAHMGINSDSFLDKKPYYFALEESDLINLPSRRAHSNKGTYGKLLIIGGGINMAGAVCFAAEAAYRAGVGLVKVMADEVNRSVIQANIPEAVFLPIDEKNDYASLIEALKTVDAVVLGPGLGKDKKAKAVFKKVLQNVNVPLLIDADGLNILSENTDMLLGPHLDIVVTPHLGEMSRLTGDAVSYIQSNYVDTAKDFAQKYDVVCVLKDFHTITAVPFAENYINLSGNSGMATAGSGDVLSGIIGSLIAQGMKAQEAAAYGVYIHGLAGDKALASFTKRSMMARDIINGLNLI